VRSLNETGEFAGRKKSDVACTPPPDDHGFLLVHDLIENAGQILTEAAVRRFTRHGAPNWYCTAFLYGSEAGTPREARESAVPRRLVGSHGDPMPYHRGMAELVFEVVQEADGGYCAECLTENIFTDGDTWQELRENVLEATTAFFFDRPRPERVRLHLVRDEVLSVA